METTMRIAVTGGCGFIGSNFIFLALSSLPDVFVCNIDKLTYAGNPSNVDPVLQRYSDRYAFECVDIAATSHIRDIFSRHGITAVVHFAAESHVDRSIADATPFISTNVQGTCSLLAAARECGISRFVHVSTDEVYGSLGPDDAPFTEATPLAPNSPYSASKAASDLLCRAWHMTYDFPVIITRCSNNYGPYQFPEKLIPLMYLKAMRDKPLPVYGDGMQVRDWIHVRDHCAGVLLALQRGRPGSVYNFGGDAERTNMQVVRAILRYCGKPESLISMVRDRPGHDRRYAMDNTVAAQELGFVPSVTFEQGLMQTLDWYAANPSWVQDVTSGAYLDFMKEWYKDRV